MTDTKTKETEDKALLIEEPRGELELISFQMPQAQVCSEVFKFAGKSTKHEFYSQ